MGQRQTPEIGISAIATYEPPWVLGNEWFGERIARKFVHQTGITARPVSEEDEVAMALRAAQKLQRDVGMSWQNCAGIVFASPSFVPIRTAKKFCDAERVRQEHLPSAARRFAWQLGIGDRPIRALNWFCSGYAKAMEIAVRPAGMASQLKHDQFLLLVTTSRISRITDYGCRQTGPLFGDMATVTLLARHDSRLYPTRFNLVYAAAEKVAADAPYFDFHLRENVLAPGPDGQQHVLPERLVFSLNGLAIADAAPRAMATAVISALEATGIDAAEVRHVVPHQAGTGIVRLAAMKLDTAGVRGEVVNGITSEVGNVSACSIPYALQKNWSKLSGTIACPTAAVGMPGQDEISRGCILLEATPRQMDIARAA